MNIMFRNIANISYLDCSKSSIFTKNRRDRALCVTGCHLVLLGVGFGRKREKSYKPRRPPPPAHLQIKMASIIGKTRCLDDLTKK